MEELAGKAGLDPAKFKADFEGPDCTRWAQAGHTELGPVGTNGTPAFYINGRYLSGAQPVGEFKKVIDEEMKKADDAIKAGVKQEDYYAHVMSKAVKKLGEEPDEE
jgi:predicted DsbA family dithiol-disulfide isomerase